MTEDPNFLDWIGLSGLASLLLGAFGYGRLHQRVSAVEEDKAQSSANAQALARLDERTVMMLDKLNAIEQRLNKEQP